MRNRIYIGIDTGVHTGIATWNVKLQAFTHVETMAIDEAMDYVKQINENLSEDEELIVRMEDARLRKWYGSGAEAQAKRQGAGSVKRDAKMWEDFLKRKQIKYECVNPMHNTTKMDDEQFKKISKWTKRTSNHARDAAMLVLGYKF